MRSVGLAVHLMLAGHAAALQVADQFVVELGGHQAVIDVAVPCGRSVFLMDVLGQCSWLVVGHVKQLSAVEYDCAAQMDRCELGPGLPECVRAVHT